MDRKTILAALLEDPRELPNFQWQGESGPVQFYEHLPTRNTLAVDADTATFYDQRMQEMHAIDAFAAVGIYHPNPIVTERFNAHVHHGREDIFERSIAPMENGPIPQYQHLDYESRGYLAGGEVHLEQHRYTGGLIYRNKDGRFISFTDGLHALSKYEALAGVVNYGSSGGTLEKLPPVDIEIIQPPAVGPFATVSAEDYQARTAPEQDPTTALSVEAAYPKRSIATTYEQALERWEAAVHLHEDLRGRPLTPQEYRQQVEINGPFWQHDLVVAQPVDGSQNIYDRPYTQITPSDQRLSPYNYERLLEHNGSEWLHSVVVREPFPLDPDTRFQEAHRRWLDANDSYHEQHGVPMSPQEYQAHHKKQDWHENSVVVVAPPLEPGLQWEDRAIRSDAEMSQMQSMSHPEYQELVRANGAEWRHSVLVLGPSPEHYGFQLPTSWRDGPRIEHHHDVSEPQITLYARTDWTVDTDGVWEHRIHYGKSENGYHYATEMSYNGDDAGTGELAWSVPYASQSEVKQAAHEAIAQLFQNDIAHGNGLSM